MFETGAQVQVRFEDGSIHDGVVVLGNGPSILVELIDGSASPPIASCRVRALHGPPTQHVGRVVDSMVVAPECGPQVAIVIHGVDESDRREILRVPVRGDAVRTMPRDADGWRIVDLSPCGIGFLTTEWKPGTVRTAVSVSSRAGSVIGDVLVKHLRRNAKGQFRFGVFVPPSEAALRKLIARSAQSLRTANGRALDRIRERVVGS